MRTEGQPERRRAAVADSATQESQCHPRKIFIGGLAHKTTTQQLREHFQCYGAIVDAVVLRWPDGRSRGFGYVTFAEASAASTALRASHQVGGRQIDVKRAVPGTNKLFVGGLPQNAAATELREHFETFGVVSDAVVMIDPVTGRSRGFGFVCFLPGQEGAAAVAAALEQYDNHRIRGKWIEVKSAASPHKLAAKEGCQAGPATAAAAPTAPEVAGPAATKERGQAARGPMTDARPVASPHRRREPQQQHQQLQPQPQPQMQPQQQQQQQRHPASGRLAPDEPCKVALPVTTTATMAAALAAMGSPPGLAAPTQATEQPAREAALSLSPPTAWPATAMAHGPLLPGRLSLASALGPLPAFKGLGEAPLAPQRAEAAAGTANCGLDAWGGLDAQSGLLATRDSLQRGLEQLLRQQSVRLAAKRAEAATTQGAAPVEPSVLATAA